MKTHKELINEWMQDPEFVGEYDGLEPEFLLFDALLQARKNAGLTQAEVAERMKTTPSVVARLEAGGGRQKHSPSIATLQKYAHAVGCQLEIKMVRKPARRSGNVGNSPSQSWRRRRYGPIPCTSILPVMVLLKFLRISCLNSRCFPFERSIPWRRSKLVAKSTQ